MRHEICKVAEIPETGTVVAPFFGREVHVYRSSERIRAVANVCLHFGGPLECREGKLVCPWHGASYDMASGDRLDGPAPQGSRLMFLSTMVEDGALYYLWADK